MKIAAVVVTYNRGQMLLDTLSGLRKQTRQLDRIFLINNASTDNTHELLQANNIFDWAELEYVLLDRNSGGAGGFRKGILLAYEAGYDWIWTMDDDVEPDENALEALLKYSHISRCMNSTKVFTKNGETQYWEQYYDFATARLIDLKNASFRRGRDWCSVNVACFEGMLAHRSLIDDIGPPDEGYFIYHDDTVFGIKASFVTNVIYVRDAIFRKKVYGYGAVTPMRAYYMIRNTFRLKRQVFATGLVGETSVFSNFLFFQNLLSQTIRAFLEVPRLSVARSLMRGWKDGFLGK